MDVLQQIIDSSPTPFITAFVLGLMTAISPCPLAANITATAYISKDIAAKRKIFYNGLIYTLGRGISYTTLGLILYFGASKFQIARFFQTYGERILGPLLIIAGILSLDIISINFPSFGNLSQKISGKFKAGSFLAALLLGIIFALAFCPYSGVLYFGMLIPITIASPDGLLLPMIFALATGLPVIIIAWLLAFSVSGVGNFYNNLVAFEKWFRRVVAIIFIGVGIYFITIFFLS
ncbi:MAG: sulfite exporter TauE/SafE family protein [Bacteroidetes bacterium]|nr:sulfite exporter TauE/SafE family protein [Bacteroidota bacterium]